MGEQRVQKSCGDLESSKDRKKAVVARVERARGRMKGQEAGEGRARPHQACEPR